MTDVTATAHGGESRSAAGGRNPWLIAVVVSIATFMLVLDTSIANVALRNIAGSLAAGMDESTWIITTYLVANSVVIPISGWLADIIGRKRYYMLCVATFTTASLLCGLAPNLPMLIVFRVIQGLGGGGMAPSEQSILADTFPPEKRSQAFALYGIAVVVAPTVGPTIGGWLTDNFSWHWIFFINVPFGILSLALVQWLVAEPAVLERERQERLKGGLKVDWIGFVLVALALGCLEVFLDEGQRNDWFASNFITTFAVISTVSFLLLIPWEIARRDPIVDMRLLFTRQFGTSFLVMMAVGAVLFSTTQLMPQLQQTAFDYTATLSGLSLMPGGIALLMLMPVSGIVSGFVQPKYLIMLGMSVVAVALWHMTALAPDASFSFFAYARVFLMIGLPFLFIPISTAAYVGLPPRKTNQASALINVARNNGGSIGVSLTNTVIAQNAQVHQSNLVAHTAQSSSTYQETLRQVSDYFIGQGSTAIEAKAQAVGWIGQLIGRQATLLAYVDVFRYSAIATALLVPLALLLRSPKPGKTAKGANAEGMT
ncbi:DHA2 family efflux MFS transporter permease subunit [Mesorhizobium sp. B1-1-8]|uniref:DHA2 family efflux MFS transporter permease subunit n=1 Tax=Mesorhizobium sp. B1-1-8 TaxID=2589976 RepID=UPI001D03303E|nr:DHA2 family efflux MFS transporter permease subunit [Mesorhizobium sp. B1-1-8]UCI09730.1 DHA2 family efflux MFS transporter permease subunit [Mesorhizobium sp. B1-1-8]